MILIIDYGMGNLGSVKRALEECGASDVVISHNESDFDRCSHAVLPGVGSFKVAMSNLEEYGIVKKIKKIVLEDKIPFLGICLGMQLLATEGDENGLSAGLDLISGKVKLLLPEKKERVPHVGWNEIHKEQEHSILNAIPDKSDFYFVHSYHFQASSKDTVIAQTPYCGNFTSIVAKDNIMGTQFHPEKSSFAGFQVLKNFMTL